MKHSLYLLCGCLLTGSPLHPAVFANSIVVNGDFEVPVVQNTTYGYQFETYYAGQQFLGWTVGGHSIDIVAEGFWEAASGVQSVDLTGSGLGSISQDIPTVPGQSYELSFAFAGNPAWSDRDPLLVTMEFLWHGTVVDSLSFNTAGHTGTSMGWSYYDYQLTAATDLTRLTFGSLTASSNRGPAIDDVKLVVIPIPDSGPGLVLCAMLLGFSLPWARRPHRAVH
jgi:choice-of-anchor C domain-containing protein